MFHAIPLVPLFIPLDRKAAWSGKWSANLDSAVVKQMGGPWDTQADACAAILALGAYELRKGMDAGNPHFDRIANGA